MSSLPELAPRQMAKTTCRLLGVVGPFPTPVWMSWRYAPCAVQSITPDRIARQATIFTGGLPPLAVPVLLARKQSYQRHVCGISAACNARAENPVGVLCNDWPAIETEQKEPAATVLGNILLRLLP